ncbi:hypothetical protein BVC80_1571g3 [Macleaya cordata]|uniref:Uncharacterized protein n=1 Tax=Macleaya cordata TaxID=56857 RepID=A0A200QPD9_MACCD|nr:hypothetical protein BVC80_1571g3 [Macleaya cordata]
MSKKNDVHDCLDGQGTSMAWNLGLNRCLKRREMDEATDLSTVFGATIINHIKEDLRTWHLKGVKS